MESKQGTNKVDPKLSEQIDAGSRKRKAGTDGAINVGSSIEPQRKKVVGLRKDGRQYVEKNSLTEGELEQEREKIRAALKQKKRLAESAGVSKAQDASAEPLVSHEDILADRRAANRLSAFKSRQRRKNLIEELQATVTELTRIQDEQNKEIERLRAELADSEAERDDLQRQLHTLQMNGASVRSLTNPVLAMASSTASLTTSNAGSTTPSVFGAGTKQPQYPYQQQTQQTMNHIMDSASLLQQLLMAQQQQASGGLSQPSQQQWTVSQTTSTTDTTTTQPTIPQEAYLQESQKTMASQPTSQTCPPSNASTPIPAKNVNDLFSVFLAQTLQQQPTFPHQSQNSVPTDSRNMALSSALQSSQENFEQQQKFESKFPPPQSAASGTPQTIDNSVWNDLLLKLLQSQQQNESSGTK